MVATNRREKQESVLVSGDLVMMKCRESYSCLDLLFVVVEVWVRNPTAVGRALTYSVRDFNKFFTFSFA
jgi:hypothetical protein